MIPINYTFFLFSFNEFPTGSIFTILSRVDHVSATTFLNMDEGCLSRCKRVQRNFSAYSSRVFEGKRRRINLACQEAETTLRGGKEFTKQREES